ncbi:MAG: hypothetical protein RR706_05040 [Muribaculaceae bacterium]
MKKSVGICVICGKKFAGVGGVEHLRRSWLRGSSLPHNCVRDAHCIVGLNFRTKVLKWNVFDVLASQRASHTAQ